MSSYEEATTRAGEMALRVVAHREYRDGQAQAAKTEVERLQEELNTLKTELEVCKDMLREAFSLALSLGAPPHYTLEEAMQHVISFPAKEVERLRAEVLAEKEAGITLGAALLEKLEIVLERENATRAAVGKLLVTHTWSCASYTYETLTPPTKRKCDCIAQDTLAARRAAGLEG